MGPAVLVFGASLLAYGANLSNGFVYDDRYVVERNPLVQELDWKGLASTSYWGEVVDAGLYRPLTLLSFGFNRALGESAAGFHLTNDVLHGAGAILTLLVARALGFGSVGALAAGLLFALHPLQSEAVNNLVGRAEILAYLFAVGSFLLYARESRGIWVGALFFLALLSKESAVFALPLFLLLLLNALKGRKWTTLAPLAVAFAAYAALRVAVLGGFGISGREIGFLDNPLGKGSLGERLLAAPVLLLQYARLVVWPRVLSADYSFDQIPLPSTPFDPRVVLGLALAAGLVFLGTRRGRIGFAALAFFLPLLGFLHLLFPLGTIFAERLTYLPMLGVALGFALAAETLSRKSRALAGLFLVTFSLLAVTRVWNRNADWKDNETLFRKTVTTAPRSARSYFLLGAELSEKESYPEAAQWFERGLAIYPAHFGARMSLGEALLAEGDAEGAELAFQEALKLAPAAVDARKAAFDAAVALGLERAREGRFEPARDAFAQATELEPDDPSGWNYLGLVREREGNIDQAREHYEQALRLEPDYVPALLNLASVKANTGELRSAEQTYRRALELAPSSYEAYNGLGIVLAHQGRTEEAAEAFEQAITIDPGLEAARENLRALGK